MARLSNERQEKFANYIANGYNQMAAYKEAGYSCKNSTAAANASKLKSDPMVAARIAELEQKGQIRAEASTAPPLPIRKPKDNGEIDIEWFNTEYISLLNLAKEAQDIKNAVTILRDMAELNKIRPEPETTNNNNNKNGLLPSNDKFPQLGNQTYVQIINQESSKDGRSLDGLIAINLPEPDAEPIFASHHAADEDE